MPIYVVSFCGKVVNLGNTPHSISFTRDVEYMQWAVPAAPKVDVTSLIQYESNSAK